MCVSVYLSQRCLVKHLEDLRVQYDHSVRDVWVVFVVLVWKIDVPVFLLERVVNLSFPPPPLSPLPPCSRQVRDSEGNMLQFLYGEDGLDVMNVSYLQVC